MHKATCPFCIEQSHPEALSQLLEVEWPFEDRLIYADAQAFLIPGLAPQLYPYLLLLPRRHEISWTHLTDEEHNAFSQILRRLLNKGPLAGERCIVAEHGGIFTKGSCMEHCHLHVLPDVVDVKSLMSTAPNPREFSGERLKANTPYVMAAHFDGSKYSGYVSEAECSVHQFLRVRLAECLSLDWWDWRERKNTQWMIKALEEYRGFSERAATSIVADETS